MVLHVGNLPFAFTEEDLKAFFSLVGEVNDVKLICDRISGESKGYGFVTMKHEADAEKAIKLFHNKDIAGRHILVSKSKVD